MRTQLALWSWGPHLRIGILFYGLEYSNEAGGISKLEPPSLELRLPAKGLRQSLYFCLVHGFKRNSLESPLPQGAKYKEVFRNRVTSKTRSAVASVVPALVYPEWEFREHWTRICGPCPQPEWFSLELTHSRKTCLQPTNQFVYDWFVSGARWLTANWIT